MKYIDAEKLIAEIERRIKEHKKDINKHPRPTLLSEIMLKVSLGAYESFKCFITSLQQEQPDGLYFTPIMRLIQKIPSENWNGTVNNYAKKLRDCLIKEGYRKDAEVLQGYISYMNGNNVPMATMDEQSEPVKGKFVFPEFLYARTLDNKTIDVSYCPQDMSAIEYVRSDFAKQGSESDRGGFLAVYVGNHKWAFVRQEQPELEKEIDACWQNWLSPSNQKEIEGVLPKTEFEMYARHFAEWGATHLNVRKEE